MLRTSKTKTAASYALLAAVAPFGVISAHAFTFQTTAPTQCGEWTVQWDGGSPPFYMVLVPTITLTAGRIMNISMPASGSPPYRHTFTLPEPAGLEMVATMYDADGWGSGGATNVLTVGDSADSSCLDSSVKADFYFWVEPKSTPAQCGSLAVTWNGDARDPVGLHGIVPGGTAWDIPIPSSAMGQRTFNWTVDIASGTDFILLMSDNGPYGTGGSTLLNVGESSDVTCLNSDSPHSTPVPPPLSTSTSTSMQPSSTSEPFSSSTSSKASMTALSTSATPSTPTSHESNAVSSASSTSHRPTEVPAAPGSSKSSSGTIIGAAVGVAVAVILALLLCCCLVRRRRRQNQEGDNEKTPPPAPLILPVAPEPVQSDSVSRQSVLRRLTVSGRQGHMRVGSRATLLGGGENRFSRDVSGAIAGLPNGAPAPSVLTNDSGSEHFELSPFPYESPPGFHTLGYGLDYMSGAGDSKSPSAIAPAAATVTGTPPDALGDNQNPFRDPAPFPPSPLTTTDTLLSPTGEKGNAASRLSSPVVRQQTLRTTHSDLWQLSNVSHDHMVAPPPPAHCTHAPSSRGAVADNVSDDAWDAAAHDPPPQYNIYDRLRTANPDPSDASSIGASSSSGRSYRRPSE